MRKILIASHGHVASGMKSAVKILTGDVSSLTAVDFYVDESDQTPVVEAFINSVGPEDDAVIFTDLLGGSVCNKVLTLQPEKHGITHVTGFNLIAVLGCLLSDEPLTPAVVDEVIATASEQLQRISVEPKAREDEETEDSFFA